MSAMDVIITQDNQGRYESTPFNVLFTPPRMFRQRAVVERVVIEVNGRVIPEVPMFKDLSGEVYFVDDENAGANNHIKVPTQEYLTSMRLAKGENRVKFTSMITHQCTFAKIFVWDTDVKIVVTDIDGTITRSDVRGHLCSRLGVKWHHNSVSNCFRKLHDLGYKIVFLTSRPITMEICTRKYIEELGLPVGPLLLSPKTFVSAFASELIFQDAKYCKKEHLTNIINLFPKTCENPLVAGFGNNENDEWAYRKCGIPRSHIFIVNKKSQILVSSGTTSYEVVATEICKFFHSLVQELREENKVAA